MVEKNHSRMFLFQNMSGLNSKSLRSVFIVNVYVLLTVIRQLEGDVKPCGPLGVLLEYANFGTGFLFHSSSPHIHHSCITLTRQVILDISYLQI